MTTIFIKEYNTSVDFPDGMPQEQMASILKQKYPPKNDVVDGVPKWGRENPNLYGVYGAAKETAKSVLPYVKYLDPEEREAFNKKDTQHQTRDLLKEVLGAELLIGGAPLIKGIGSIASPVVERFAPQVVKKGLNALTKQRSLDPFKSLENVIPEPVIKPIVKGEPALPKTPVMPTAGAQGGPSPIPRQDVMGLDEQKQVIQKIIQEGIVDKERPYIADETQRAMYNIADTITKYPDYGKEILTKYNITPEELSSEILKAGSVHGKGLNQFSQWARAMKKAFPDDPVIQETLGSVGKLEPLTTWDKVKNVYRAVDDKRRMLMVTQIATAARNAASQGARYGADILDSGIQGVFKTVGGVPKKEAFAQFMGDWTAILNRMSPKQRANLEGVLSKYPETKAEMLSAPIHDITLGGKLSNALMYLNRTQEYFYRKMIFDSRITAWGKTIGKDPYKTNIPQHILEKASKDSMEMTFSANQEKGFGKGVMDAYKAIPMLTTIHPYPRFWTNAVKFLWDFNPTGYLSAASRARFFSKDPNAVYQAASRATLGTLMLGAGLEMRNSEYAGEKWYEINVGKDRYIDARPFAPFSTYLFLGEAISHPEKLSGKDWAEGMLSISRIAGTGLTLIDLIRTDSIDSTKKLLKNFAGQYLSGFTVPLQTVKDFIGEDKVLNTQESPLLGPAASKIPFVGEAMLNEQPSLTRGEILRREDPRLRQLTGLTIKTKTPVEKEIDKVGLQRIYPQTGDATLDRLITEQTGWKVGQFGNEFIKSARYKNADAETKKYMLKEIISLAKQDSKQKILIPYIEGRLSERKTADKRFEYLADLVDHGRIGRANLEALFTRNPSLFGQAKQEELKKKAYLK